MYYPAMTRKTGLALSSCSGRETGSTHWPRSIRQTFLVRGTWYRDGPTSNMNLLTSRALKSIKGLKIIKPLYRGKICLIYKGFKAFKCMEMFYHLYLRRVCWSFSIESSLGLSNNFAKCFSEFYFTTCKCKCILIC